MSVPDVDQPPHPASRLTDASSPAPYDGRVIRTRPAWLALVVAWLVGTAAVLIGPSAPAGAAAAPELSIALTSLRTVGSGKKTSIELQGTVTNTGAQPAFGVRVALWRTRDPIRETTDFDTVVAGQSQPWGERMPWSEDHYFRIKESDESFDPGATAEFTVRGTLTDLGFTADGAVYLTGAQVLGTADASSNYQVLAQTRTFYATDPGSPLPLASVVLLQATPTKIRQDVFANERLVGELTGRLDSLLTLAGRPGMSWLVDPALIDEVTDLADGYTVVDGDDTRPGTGQAAAQAWLARFRALSSRYGARTLFASPDILGAEHNDSPQVLTHALEAGSDVAGLDTLPLIVLPHDGLADATLPAWLADADADAIAVRTAGIGQVLVRGRASSTLLRLAPALDAAGGPGTDDGPVQRTQRLLAEAVLGGGQVRLITSTGDADADAAANPKWLARTTLDRVLDGTPARPAATLTLPADAATLPESRFVQYGMLEDDFARYRSLVPDSVLAEDESATLSRLVSDAWIDSTGAGSWLRAVNDTFSASAIQGRVSLSASPRVLMSSRTNEFPVTVTNRLAEPIVVRITFASDNPQRISIADSELITVGAGQSQTVNVRPEASSNGLVNITAGLRTASGEPVGRTTRIAVEVTDLGVIGWIIVVVSGVVLVATTALRIRQVRRKQREEEQ